MFDMNKLQQLRTVAQNPAESEYLQALITILVELEHRQLEAVEELHESMEVDGIDNQSDRETRKAQLLDLADAVANGEFQEWWFDRIIGGHIENPDDARPYAGLSEDEWEEQIERWAESWRSRAPEEFREDSDRDIARLHVERKFGVSLDAFEREVVNWERKDALRTVLAGNFEAVEQGIQAATAAAEADTDAEDGGETDE